jgi:DNA (cytosine-5)-methyltransferase 1
MSVRQLPRLENMQKDAAPNEVVFTSMIIDVPPARVVRRCFIRVFEDLKSVVTPYDRGGIGDCFFIRFEPNLGQFIPCRKLGDDELRQGYSLQEPLRKPVLKGMDLFCGGRNFGRGLEEGGAIEMKWAVDFDSVPLHKLPSQFKGPRRYEVVLLEIFRMPSRGTSRRKKRITKESMFLSPDHS